MLMGILLCAALGSVRAHRPLPRERSLVQLDVPSPVAAGWPELTPEESARIVQLAHHPSGDWTTKLWPSYYSLKLPGLELQGPRDPKNRHDLLWGDETWAKDTPQDKGSPFNRVTLQDKSYLDLGANMGGMIFPVADKIRWGRGVELDGSLVNLGNTIAEAYHMPIKMKQFDIESKHFQDISETFPGGIDACRAKDFTNCVDVASMFAVNRWISDWKDAIRFLRKVSKHFVMEINWREDSEENVPKGAGMVEKEEYKTFMEQECDSVKYIDEALVKNKCPDCCISMGCRVLLHCYKSQAAGGYGK